MQHLPAAQTSLDDEYKKGTDMPQRCTQTRVARPADCFQGSVLTVDPAGGVAVWVVGNLTLEWDYATLLALRNRLDAALRQLEPPTPAGRTYAPKLGEH